MATELLATGSTAASSTDLVVADGATRSDGTHDSDAGAVVRANAIKAWLDAKGW